MDSYRESSIKAKAIRAGILDARPVSKGQRERVKDWLIVRITGKNLSRAPFFSDRKYVGVIEVSGEYTSEDVAMRALPTIRSYESLKLIYGNEYYGSVFGTEFVINRKLYEEQYSPLWKALYLEDKKQYNQQIKTKTDSLIEK